MPLEKSNKSTSPNRWIEIKENLIRILSISLIGKWEEFIYSPLPFFLFQKDHSQRDTCISPSQNLAIHHPLSLKPVSISGEGGGGDIKSTMVDREAYRAQWNGIFRGIASHPFAEERSVDWLPTGLWKERSWSLLAIFKPLSLSNPPNSTRTWLVYLLGKSRRRRKARILLFLSNDPFPFPQSSTI